MSIWHSNDRASQLHADYHTPILATLGFVFSLDCRRVLLMVPLQASFTIATMPARSASGSVGHASTRRPYSESIWISRDKVWAKVSEVVCVTALPAWPSENGDASLIPTVLAPIW